MVKERMKLEAEVRWRMEACVLSYEVKGRKTGLEQSRLNSAGAPVRQPLQPGHP
jgi:hypothetical protein